MRILLFLAVFACLQLVGCGGGGGGGASQSSFAGSWGYSSSESRMSVHLTSYDSINYTGTVHIINYGVHLDVTADISGQFPQTEPTAGHTMSFTPTITNIVSSGNSMYNDKFTIVFESDEVPYNPNQAFNLYSKLNINVGAEGLNFWLVPSWYTMGRR